MMIKDTIYIAMFVTGLMIFFFLVGWMIFNFPYADAQIIKEFEEAIVIITSASSILPEASAYPYSYYQPFDTSLGYWDNGYYERPAYDYFDNFYYYDYDTRPTTYEYWEWTIDWDDTDNWSSSTGLPIIKNYNYNVYVEPIPQYNDYWVDTFIYGNYPY